ncbi:Beta-galactosidase [Planctomycetes bacterium MalM25]|nr:Beta-galactosidase [Planctomycetes bacterium MalM25]
MATVVLALQGVVEARAERRVENLNLDWRYHRGDAGEAAATSGYDDSAWEAAVLPHTYALTSINLDDSPDDQYQLTFHRDLSWYRRNFTCRAKAGQRVFLEFEGAHQITDLWVNGQHLGQHATGGYTPFHFEITEHVVPGENVVAVRLDNRVNEEVPPDGDRRDYILFGGLYRDVRLVVTDPLRITFPWEARDAGVRITTPSVSPRSATVTVETTVENAGPEPHACRVVTRVADPEGRVVEKLVSRPVAVEPGRTHTFVQTGGVTEGLRLWSCDDPNLYHVHTTIESGGDAIDQAVNPLGFRWFNYHPREGFLLNGEPIELIGVNRHQQIPYMGDAVPDNLHRADAIKFKRAGVNVVRLAHYPHDDEFLNACDRLGMLVAEEAPTWIEVGPPLWMDRLERATRVMIRNHRNHPSVWCWGGGVNHRGPIARLHYTAKEEDPTRITMSNSTLWTGPTHSGVTDLYSVMDYRGARVPEGEPLFAMEHSGSIDARGHQAIVSRYKADPARIGLALWAAHDGFSFKKRDKQYPNLSVWSAALWDPFRHPKPAYHWYQAELTDEPMVYIPDDRAQRDDGVTVFTNCDEVELRVAGQERTRLKPATSDKHLKAPPLLFPVEWLRGEAVAVGYSNGEPVAEHRRRIPEAAHHLELTIDTDGFGGAADGSSVLYAYATVVDQHGAVIPGDTPPVSFTVGGPAEIIGDASIGANPVVWRRGLAPALLRVGREAGEIVLTARAEGLGAASAQLTLNKPGSGPHRIAPPFEPLRLRVDLGGAEQHVQETWTEWTHESGDSTLETTADGDTPCELTITLTSPRDLDWTSSWGVPGDLCFLIEDAAVAHGEATLEIAGLPVGNYRLRTWHHRVVSERDEAPPLAFQVDDAGRDKEPVTAGFKPTYGKKIQVSAAGGGGAGDGGSNLAAGGYAETRVTASGEAPVLLRIAADSPEGPIALSGLEIVELRANETSP